MRHQASKPLSLLVFLIGALLLAACQEEGAPLRAKVATSRNELVGGPVAYADVGDLILENDKIRVAILDEGKSWGPGVFGGSLVDADIRRDDARTPPGSGRDRLVEIFPFANLLVPAPLTTQVRVLKDGSDGKEAIVRVTGKGRFLFEALSILKVQKGLLEGLYSPLTTDLDFQTDYILRPGDSFVTLRTWLIVPGKPGPDAKGKPGEACKTDADCSAASLVCRKDGTEKTICQCKPEAELGCPQTCDIARAVDAEGCPTCACETASPMVQTTGPKPVFGVILGDLSLNPDPVNVAGLGAGDFVFFGNQNDIFLPGHGFDEEKPVWDAIFEGRDTFTLPLDLDFVSAAGGDVSYAYYTRKTPADSGEPRVLVPLFTSAATAFVTATYNCKFSDADDSACKKARVFEYERYLAVGKGDIASVTDIVLQHRQAQTGTIKGYVRWDLTGAPAKNASVAVLHDPDPAKAWSSLQEVVDANRLAVGSPGVLNHIDADPGLDLTEDGDIEATLPPGDYVLVGLDAHKVVAGKPLKLKVEAGRTHVVAPALPTPARVVLRALDNHGAGLPAKLTIVKLDAQGQPLFRDGGRLTYLGQGRLGNGVQYLGFSPTGHFDVPLQAGRYQIIASHGIEYGVSRHELTLKDGQVETVTAVLPHEVDTKGWVSTDFHLHAEPSFDSGMPLDQRVQTIAAEGVDYVASTDHDVLSNYLPLVRLLGLEPWLKAVVGSEISTLEIGHYIGFPLQYKQLDVPHHGSVDWFCKPSDQILGDILSRSGFSGAGEQPTTIIAHPRDGFLGWLDQAGVNGYSLTRAIPSLEKDNTTLRTVACDHDAMEVFNAKRFDMVHTATVREVQTFERCLARIDRAGVVAGKLDPAKMAEDLQKACPELNQQPLATCPAAEGPADCKMRHRAALAQEITSQILTRTPEEQKAWLEEPVRDVAGAAKPEDKATQGLDELAKLCAFDPDKPADLDKPFETVVPPNTWNRPCGKKDGVLSDHFRFLEHGLTRTILAGSDSHGFKQEPGLPRTWVKASTDQPSAIDPREVRDNLKKGQAVPSYGPFVDARIGSSGPGSVVPTKAGDKLTLSVDVQTASWFGVDRVEVYLNGEVVHVQELAVDPKRIVDLAKTFDMTVPSRDSWIVVVAVGRDPKHLMGPVYLDVPFGELQLSRVANMAFGNLFSGNPVIANIAKNLLPRPARIPDFYPVFPMGITNAIYLDTNGNGRYDAPNPMPAFCSPRCDVATGEILDDAFDVGGKPRKCTDLQSNYKCLTPEQRCGLDIPGVCDIYAAQQAGALRSH